MTPKRVQKIKKMLLKRQTGLSLLMENIHKPYNLSAIARTCDSVGVGHIHATWSLEEGASLNSSVARGSNKWIDLSIHANIREAYKQFHANNFQIIAAHLADTAVDFRAIDYTRDTVIVLGQELDGLSSWATDNADQCVNIPMYGMAGSLNVSVAAAVILYEAQRQRESRGMYDTPQMTEEAIRAFIEGRGKVETHSLK